MNTIREYLETLAELMDKAHTPNGFRWPSIHRFLLNNGLAMAPAVMAAVRGPMKQCFYTSATRAMRQCGRRFVYCEGYSIPDGLFPMEHAWLYDTKDRCVMETTWQKPGLEYFGIAFNTWFLRKDLKNRDSFGLIGNWEHGFPLLRMTNKQLAKAIHRMMKNEHIPS